jgi:hypothetical protein
VKGEIGPGAGAVEEEFDHGGFLSYSNSSFRDAPPWAQARNP